MPQALLTIMERNGRALEETFGDAFSSESASC